MNVEAILRAKGNAVATIPSGTTVAAAVRELKARGIGALVVSDDGRTPAGILSERDIVHAVAEHGAAVLTMTADRLMTRRVVTCRPEDTVSELMARMTERRFRHLPVVKDGVLCGIISIGDLVKSRIEEVEFEADSLRHFIAG
ncbi:MAG TPA: CBS domain-containing protein [Stellaceae bacterium]|nr:CBS domain-containing protein [Stellaceae bacterium]